MEHCIVYFSNWAGPFQEAELITILEKYRQTNAVEGITSVTFYVRGHIIQVLEGQKAAVDRLYGRIEKDRHHTNVTTILSRPISSRLFTGTALGYDTISSAQLEEIKAIVNLDDVAEETTPTTDSIILKMIKTFYQSNRFN